MKKRTLVSIIVAASLIGAGLIVATIGICLSGFNFNGLSTQERVSETIEITEDFENINIEDVGDASIRLSKDGVCRIECTFYNRNRTVATVSDGTLNVTKQDERKWFDHIGIVQLSDTTVIYLPKNQYASLKLDGDTGDFTLSDGFFFESADIKTTTGDIMLFHTSFSGALSLKYTTGDVEISDTKAKEITVRGNTGRTAMSDITAEDIKIQATTGKVSLLKIRAENVSVKTDTGDQTFSDIVLIGEIRIEADTGDVSFTACDAAQIYVNTDTGDVAGTFLSEKIFIVRTDTGDLDVPNSVSGGRCEITTDTGDVKISIS